MNEIMSEKQYESFRQRMLSVTDGSNIHRINGYLGIILNSIETYNYWIENNKFDEARRTKQLYEDIYNKLMKHYNMRKQ